MRRASSIRRSANAGANVISLRLRAARALHDPPLSMEETSQRVARISDLEITRNMIVKIETNRRSVYDYEVRILAEALGVDVRFLLGISDDPGTFDAAASPALPVTEHDLHRRP